MLSILSVIGIFLLIYFVIGIILYIVNFRDDYMEIGECLFFSTIWGYCFVVWVIEDRLSLKLNPKLGKEDEDIL